jgi:TatD DNase family protein
MTTAAKNADIVNKIFFHAVAAKIVFIIEEGYRNISVCGLLFCRILILQHRNYFISIHRHLLINIHTHHRSENRTEIQSLFENFEEVQANGFYSIGLHPCYVLNASFNELVQWSSHKNVIAIGECGLDSVCNTDTAQQQLLFTKQIQLANELNKPLIIHCVKAWDEVLRLLQPSKVPVVFHGFNKSKEMALQLIAKGYYLSFGKALQQQRMQEIVSLLPAERILLETDVSDISIETVYELAANAAGVEVNTFSLQILNNVIKVFGDKITKDDN